MVFFYFYIIFFVVFYIIIIFIQIMMKVMSKRRFSYKSCGGEKRERWKRL